MDDTELAKLFRAPEGENLERKESWTDEAKKVVCAFANDLADSGKLGVLFIGQKDDLTCAGLSDATISKLLETIPAVKNYVLPSPDISVEKKTIDGCTVVTVTVQPAAYPPVRLDGRVFVRVGSTTRTATAEDEKKLTDKKNRNWEYSMYFEQRAPSMPVRIGDLDRLFIEREYLPHAVSQDVLDENNRPLDMQLSSLRFLTPQGAPNNAAILCFYANPKEYWSGAYIQFARFAGDSMDSRVLDQKEMLGPVFQQIRMTEEKFSAHVSVPAQIGGGAESPDYPMRAIEQAVRNAVMHRDYETAFTTPIHCYWFSNRIEIASPGGLVAAVGEDVFGDKAETSYRYSAYRNPLLAEALKVEKFVGKFGAGIGIIKKSMRENGNPPPIFKAETTHVMVTLPGKPA